ncbi:hypothetical protein M501DRAFT_1003174 [Patellaria atrata CBS 101060]|uniref:Uncharacterized protein n=1 Tax=Patellaria atrata CBS 101060 TaxID=1346257 RepID=A0A9P4VTN2_9PEZI|nr:hypothetical protein M501DRAFT_1003174 [Patellaria atrata CBS 101060]
MTSSNVTENLFDCMQYAVNVSNASALDSYLYCDYYRGDVFAGDFYIDVNDFRCSCLEFCECPPFDADPDIAGIGVLAAFVVTSALTMIATALYLVLTRSNHPETWNPIDKIVRKPLDFIREKSATLTSLEDNDHPLVQCIFDLIISLSDTQLILGIAMLSSALIKLHQDTITVYHFNTIANLAWLSSGVHLLTLSVIRLELIGSAKPAQRVSPSKKIYPVVIIRVACMLLLAALLLYCSWVSGYGGWYNRFECPAECTIGLRKGGEPLQWTIVNFVLILYAYPGAVFQLWAWGKKKWIDKFRHRIIDKKGGINGDVKPIEGDVSKRTPLMIIKDILVLLFWYVRTSEIVEVLLAITWFSLGFYWTFSDRHSMHQYMEENARDEENTINGFGQLVPLFLLLAPLLQLLESWAGQAGRSAHRSDHANI